MLRGWWTQEPKDIPKLIVESDAPAVVPIGAVKNISKTIIKSGSKRLLGGGIGAGLVGIGGFLAGTLFGGKGQDVKPTQTTTVTPDQTTTQDQRMLGLMRLWSTVRAAQRAKISARKETTIQPKYTYEGPTITTQGDVSYIGPTTITETTDIQGISQEQFAGTVAALLQAQQQQAAPEQIVTVTPTQATTAQQMDMTGLLILGGIAAAAYVLTRGKKK